jgi:hypothetical protein
MVGSMDSSRYKRALCGLFLALAALLGLCGTVFAFGSTPAANSGLGRAALPGGPRIADRVAVRRFSSKGPRHHRLHHKASSQRGVRGEEGTALALATAVAGQGSRGNGAAAGSQAPTGATPPPSSPAPPPPPVEPVRTSGCFSSPHSCGFPDSTNTGVPAGVSLRPSGSLTITQPGTLVSGLQVTGTINVLASNVTIENTRVIQNGTCGPTNTCGNSAIRIDEAASGTTIRHVETASVAGDTCEHDIRNTGGTVTIEGAYLHACDSNVYAAGPTVLKDSYGIAKIEMSEDHIENIYFNETSFSAIHDTLLNPVEQTAVIFGNSGGGTDVANCTNQLTILESLLAGGGYSLYPCAHASHVGSSSFNIQGNHFARCATAESYNPGNGTHPCKGGSDSSGYFANSGSFGLATDYFSGTWRGNVWDNNLGRVCVDGRSSGCG